MRISQIIKMLEDQISEEGDDELMIYNSDGDLIDPKSFSYGAMSTDKGFIGTVSFSDIG